MKNSMPKVQPYHCLRNILIKARGTCLSSRNNMAKYYSLTTVLTAIIEDIY